MVIWMIGIVMLLLILVFLYLLIAGADESRRKGSNRLEGKDEI